MKRGKRYVDGAKKVDRTVQYESADAIKLVKENATASLTRPSSFTSVQVVMDVTLSSRSVVLLYCRTEQVKPFVFWYLQKAQK